MVATTKPRLYERVAERLARAVETGALRPGDRLPSVRRLSAQEQVSVSTVLQAYLQLEADGLVETRPQSGHYVRQRRPTFTEEPATTRPLMAVKEVSVSALVSRVVEAARDPRMVPLGCASLSSELLPVNALNRHLAEVARFGGGSALQYELPPGNARLRRQLARRSLDWGSALRPDDLVITSGASEAVQLALLAVAGTGATIAIESPAYYGSLQLIEALGMRALEIPTHPRDGMDIDALEDALRRHPVSAVLAVPNFSNPLGALMPDASKQRLVELLGRHEIPLIEDDIYGDLHFGPRRPRPAASFDTCGNVLLCGSLSKTLAPGFRVGWIAPGRFYEKVQLLKFSLSIASATPMQLAVAEFLASGAYDHHLRALRRKLACSMGEMGAAVARHFPEGTRASRPQGGTMIWVEMPRRVDALELHRRALEARISVIPGPIFSAQGRYRNCIRISCAQPHTSRIEGAVAKLGELARELAGS